MMSSFGLKQFVLCNFPEALKIESRLSYLHWLLELAQCGQSDKSFDEVLELESEREHLRMLWSLLELESESLGFDRSDLQREVMRLNNAFYARLKRLRQRVTHMICTYNSLWFVTFTFTDSTLIATSKDYRKRLIKAFLADYPEYVANIDYGKLNGREHYHALVAGESIINSNWTDRGFIYPELVNLDVESSVVPLSKYVAKLSNHAVKETAQQNKLIYSRKKKEVVSYA